MDLTGKQAERARANGLRVQIQDITQGLPFPDRFCSAVVASEVIEHLVDTDGLLEEILRVLKPGGSLLLTTANLASLNNRVRLLFGCYPTAMDYSSRDGAGHVRYYTMGLLVRQILDHGFHIERRLGSYLPMVPTRWTFRAGLPRFLHPIGFAAGDFFPTLSMELIVHAKRPAE